MKLTYHGSTCQLPSTKNPVARIRKDQWVPSLEKCNHCGGECQEAPVEVAPNQSMRKLINCTNKFHLKGEYGFYVFI